MKILYLSYFAASKTFDKICEAKLDPSVARQNYDEVLIKNLLSNESISADDIEIVSYLPYSDEMGEVPNEDVYLGKKLSYVWTKRKDIITIIKATKKVKKFTKKHHKIVYTVLDKYLRIVYNKGERKITHLFY